jgi:hypothetical protein
MTYDWVHNTLQDGTLTVEVQLLLTACVEHGLSRASLMTALRDDSWEFPSQSRAKSKQLHRVFDPYREAADSDKLKCSASELLGLYGLLRYLIAEKVPRAPELSAKLASFAALCRAVDVILMAKRGELSAADAAAALPEALSRHMSLHLAAYGNQCIRPKHHWNLDVGQQLGRDGLILDAFVIERTHLKVKVAADMVTNTTRFERSVLALVVNGTMRSDSCTSWAHALLGKPQQLAQNTFASTSLRVYGLVIAIGDVVLLGDKCGKVQLCLLADVVLHIVVQVLTATGQHTDHWGNWLYTDVQEAWVAASVQIPLAWKAIADNAVLVIRG